MFGEPTKKELKAERKLEKAKAEIKATLAKYDCDLISADEWHHVLLYKYVEGKSVTISVK